MASITNCRTMSDLRAPTARRTPISRVRSRMLGQHNVHNANASYQQRDRRYGDHDNGEQPLGSALFGKKLGGNNHAVITGAVVGRVQNGAHDLGHPRHVCAVAQVQINSVDLVTKLAVTIFKAQDGCIERHIDDVVEVLRRDACNFGLGASVGAHNPDYPKPFLVDFDVLLDGVCAAEQIGFRAGS